MNQEPSTVLAEANARIAWVLDHPHMSLWLKQALRTAEGLDPLAIQNDVEILSRLIIARAQAQIEIAMTSARFD